MPKNLDNAAGAIDPKHSDRATGLFKPGNLGHATGLINPDKIGRATGLIMPDSMPCDNYEAAIDAEVTRINEKTAEVKSDNDADLKEDLDDTISTSHGYLDDVPLAGAVTLEMVSEFAVSASSGLDVEGKFTVNMP